MGMGSHFLRASGCHFAEFVGSTLTNLHGWRLPILKCLIGVSLSLQGAAWGTISIRAGCLLAWVAGKLRGELISK